MESAAINAGSSFMGARIGVSMVTRYLGRRPELGEGGTAGSGGDVAV